MRRAFSWLWLLLLVVLWEPCEMPGLNLAWSHASLEPGTASSALKDMAGLSSLGAGLLLLALCACCVLPTGSVVVPSSCCLSFISQKFPERRVVSYQLTSQSVCPIEGVIFTTRKGQKFCADPKMLWVQRYMKKLDARQKKVTARTRPVGRRVLNQRRPANSTSV